MFGQLLREYDSRMFIKAVEYFKVVLDLDNSSIPIEVKLVDNIGTGRTDGTCRPYFTNDSTRDNLKLEKVQIKIKQQNNVIVF